MTDTALKQKYKMFKNINPKLFLVIGVLTMTASHMSYSIDLVAWISSVPFLIYLNTTKGLKSRLLFVLAIIISWSLVTAKIVTTPIPFAMVFLFSIPISLFHLPAYLLWDKFKKYKWSFLLFPIILTIMEWVQYTFTPFASWGVAAYTQNHSLSVMQTVSIFGMPGLSFLIYWVNISVAEIISNKKTTYFTFQIPLTVFVFLVMFGALRFDLYKSKSKDTITVATVGTNSEISGLPFPSTELNNTYKDSLLLRTQFAAKNGAQIVSWNEAAIFIQPAEEDKWQVTLSSLAKELNISLIASYVVPVSIEPLKLENKFLSINSKGEIVYQYLKHQPVPGEPSIKGKEPYKIMTDKGLNIGGAICYDFDYPYIAKEFGKLNANIVAIPSSDWRGIDPLHARMAAFRAIEQGYSLLRSTRFGLSAAITPLGEITSQQSSFDNNTKIMVAELPTKKITTLYGIIGDLFIYCCFGILIVVFVSIYTQKKLTNKLNTNDRLT